LHYGRVIFRSFGFWLGLQSASTLAAAAYSNVSNALDRERIARFPPLFNGLIREFFPKSTSLAQVTQMHPE
jgi:hypothetical protein